MKILTINSHDSHGGAGRAAYNLFKGLENIGLDSQMLVATKATSDHGIVGPESKLSKLWHLILPHIDSIPNRFLKTNNGNLHSPAWTPSFIGKKIAIIDPDVIHLHWVQSGFLPVEALARLKKPIVWTLHDMWPFSGAEHYSNGSERYKQGYNRNNRQKDESGFDLNRWAWKRKKKAWKRIDNLTIVAPSKWMAKCAAESVLFKDRRIEVIPVGLDHNLYRPRNKQTVREILGMPLGKKIILIGALNFLKDKRKGGHYLKKAFELLVKAGCDEKYEVYVLGTSAPLIDQQFGFKTNYFGTNRDDLSLALLYAAVDVFVAPSIEENFSATVFESLSCGTPVVAFDIGGMPDMITHKHNGYLAKPYLVDDLAAGIKWVLENTSWSNLSINARKFIENECTLKIQAKRYKRIYDSIIANHLTEI
jgi:glycosyltransferase involved in cell wall biosynthesis